MTRPPKVDTFSVPMGGDSSGREPAMSAKAAVFKLLERLPDDATIEDIQYHLYVLQKIRAGQEAADAGELVSHEEVMRELAKWLE